MISPLAPPISPLSPSDVIQSSKKRSHDKIGNSGDSGEAPRKRRLPWATQVEPQDLATLCGRYHKITVQSKALAEEKGSLKKAILEALPSDKVETDQFKVSRIRQIRVNTSLDDARALGCTFEQEVVDKKKLKALFEEGETIPKVTISEYFRLSMKP